MNLARNRRSLTSVRRGSREPNSGRCFAFIPALLVSFAIGVMLSPSPFFIQNRATPAIPYDSDDGGFDSFRHLGPVGRWAGVTLPPDSLGNNRTFSESATVTGMRWAWLLSRATVFPKILFLASYEREGQLSIRGLTKTTSEGGRGRGIFGPQGMLLEDGSLTSTHVDLRRNNVGIDRVAPDSRYLTPFQAKAPRDLKSANMECPGPRCPDLPVVVVQKPQKDSSQDEDPASPGDSPSTHAGSMEITYDASPPSVAPPALGALCDARLPATPPPILVACGALNTAMTGNWAVSFQYGTLEGSLNSDDWHVGVDIGSGFHVVVGGALPDLLDEFGIDQIRGTSGPAREGLRMIGTSASLQVLKEATTPIAQFFAGITYQGPAAGYFAGMTSQGPAGGVMFTSGQFGGQVTATTADGQVQLAGALSYRAGDFRLGYTWGTDGSGLIGRFKRDPFDFAIQIGSDIAVGLSYTPEGGPTVQASWSGTNGLEIALAASFKISFGPTGLTLEPFNPSVTLPLGRGTLVLTPASPSDGPSPPSVDFELSLPAPASPPDPTSGAMLIVRTCVVTEREAACGPEDSSLVLQVFVDGTPARSAAKGIPVSPGHHVVTVPSEAVPQLLVSLSGLRCDLTIPTSAVGTCELLFRQVGTPGMNPVRPADPGH